MSELRVRMVRDMTVRELSPQTHKACIAAVVGLAPYYRRSPDQISTDEVQTYVAHLYQDRHRSWSAGSQAALAAHAFRSFYHVTLGLPRTAFHVPAPRQPQKLPESLSRAEVCGLLAAPTARRADSRPGKETESGWPRPVGHRGAAGATLGVRVVDIALGSGQTKPSVTRGTARAARILAALGITDLNPPASPPGDSTRTM